MREKLSTLEPDHHNLSIYLFGSFIYQENPNDVDILLVFVPENRDSFKQVIVFRHLLEVLIFKNLNLHADVIILTSEEEKDLNYIKKTKAIKLL